MLKLVLASQSKYRKNLLQRGGFDFECQTPEVDEEKLKTQGPADPDELTRFLALKKAESLLDRYPNQWILGCDQAAAYGRKVIGKPGDRERAFQQLKRLSGRWHRLVTSMALVKNGEIPTVMTDITRIRLRTLTDEEIYAYLDHDQPFDCAASYKFEKTGICLIDDLRTKDPTAIEGLSLIALTSFFVRLGFPLAQIIKLS